MADEQDDEGIYDLIPQAEETTETEEETETTDDAEETETEDALGADDEEGSPASGEEKGEDDGGKPKKKKGASERIDELVRDRGKLSRENEELRRELAARRENDSGDAGGTPPEKPSQEDFETYDDFIVALTKWTTEQQLAEAERRIEAKTAAKHEKDANAARIKENMESARKRLPQFDDVVAAVRVTEEVASSVTRSRIPGELAYFLGKNPGVAEKLNRLDPLEAAIEIGRIETKIEARMKNSTPPRERQTIPGPAPQKPLGGGKSFTEKSIDEMSHEEYRKMREGQG